jgi:hypothetical protein
MPGTDANSSTRRTFFTYFGGLGLSATVLPTCCGLTCRRPQPIA